MWYRCAFLFFVFGCVSCSEQPSSRLTAAKMQRVLYDLHLAEAYSTIVGEDSTHRRNERNKDSLAVYYASILRHHNLTLDEFQQSLQWYKQRPEQLDSVYSKMIPEMLKLEAKHIAD